jgi:hypothetical protein
VECAVPLARVYLDETFVGRVDQLGALPVASGRVRMQVRADGYFTAYRDVVVHRGERRRERVSLYRVPALESGS